MGDRRANAFRQLFAAALALFAFLYVVAHCHGCNPLTAEDKKSIAIDAVQIEVCKQNGRICRAAKERDCFAVYDDCITDAGLR